MVKHLIEAGPTEINKHQRDHRVESNRGRTDRHSHKGLLRDRRVNHSLPTIFGEESHGKAKDSTPIGHILSQNYQALMASHFLINGLSDGKGQSSELSHWKTPTKASFGSGNGLLSAN